MTKLWSESESCHSIFVTAIDRDVSRVYDFNHIFFFSSPCCCKKFSSFSLFFFFFFIHFLQKFAELALDRRVWQHWSGTKVTQIISNFALFLGFIFSSRLSLQKTQNQFRNFANSFKIHLSFDVFSDISDNSVEPIFVGPNSKLVQQKMYKWGVIFCDSSRVKDSRGDKSMIKTFAKQFLLSAFRKIMKIFQKLRKIVPFSI